MHLSCKRQGLPFCRTTSPRLYVLKLGDTPISKRSQTAACYIHEFLQLVGKANDVDRLGVTQGCRREGTGEIDHEAVTITLGVDGRFCPRIRMPRAFGSTRSKCATHSLKAGGLRHVSCCVLAPSEKQQLCGIGAQHWKGNMVALDPARSEPAACTSHRIERPNLGATAPETALFENSRRFWSAVARSPTQRRPDAFDGHPDGAAGDQYMCWPPLTERVEPVMKPLSSSTR